MVQEEQWGAGRCSHLLSMIDCIGLVCCDNFIFGVSACLCLCAAARSVLSSPCQHFSPHLTSFSERSFLCHILISAGFSTQRTEYSNLSLIHFSGFLNHWGKRNFPVGPYKWFYTLWNTFNSYFKEFIAAHALFQYNTQWVSRFRISVLLEDTDRTDEHVWIQWKEQTWHLSVQNCSFGNFGTTFSKIRFSTIMNGIRGQCKLMQCSEFKYRFDG